MPNASKVGTHQQSKPETELLPDYANWLLSNPGHSLARYARSGLKAEHFFAVASILCPPLIEYEGGLFLEEGFDPTRFAAWVRQLGGDLTKVERVMNHRHIRDISQSLNVAPFPLVLSAGLIVRDCLDAWLRYLHPDIPTAIDMSRKDDNVEVTFTCIRHS